MKARIHVTASRLPTPYAMTALVRFAALTALALVLAGCPPRIKSFRVQPATRCAGDAPAVARWDGRGDLALQIQLDDSSVPKPETTNGDPDAQPPPLGPEGSHVITLRLTASDGQGQERAAQTRFIQEFPDAFQNVIAFQTKLADGAVVGAGDKNSERWGDRFEVATVAALDRRRIEVAHAGKSVTLEAAPSTALSGTPLEGRWELKWLRDGSSPPEVLRIDAVVRCKRGTP